MSYRVAAFVNMANHTFSVAAQKETNTNWNFMADKERRLGFAFHDLARDLTEDQAKSFKDNITAGYKSVGFVPVTRQDKNIYFDIIKKEKQNR